MGGLTVFTWCLERAGCGGCSHGALRGQAVGGVHMVP